MENNVVLDSNIWIAFLNKSDSQHKKAVKTFKEIENKIIVPEYIILEVCSVLSIRASKKTADKFLEIVLENNDIQILLSNEFLFKNTIREFKKTTSRKFSFVDIYLSYLSQSVKVITFDERLRRKIK